MRTAASRSKPTARELVIVIPDRDVPGLSANAWDAPTISASRTSKSSTLRLPGSRSAQPSRTPNPISDTAMIVGVPSRSSIDSSKTAPTAAAGAG